MNQERSQVQAAAQASPPGQAAGGGPEVGGVHSSEAGSEFDLHARSAGYRAVLKAKARDSARSHASQRSKGPGDGPAKAGIETPEKVRELQRTLYRKAKAAPQYRFWTLQGEIMRRAVLELALQRVAANQGGPGVDGQRVATITASPESRRPWLDALQGEVQAKPYRPSPVRRVFIPKSHGGQRPLGIPTVQDRVVQMAATLVVGPIFEADFHPRSFGFRPRRNVQQAIEEIVRALRRGRPSGGMALTLRLLLAPVFGDAMDGARPRSARGGAIVARLRARLGLAPAHSPRGTPRPALWTEPR